MFIAGTVLVTRSARKYRQDVVIRKAVRQIRKSRQLAGEARIQGYTQAAILNEEVANWWRRCIPFLTAPRGF